MERKEKSLVILAAGIGSRFKVGVKQLESVGPSGECIMEYSIYDALEAGFNRIVFIIRRDIQELFDRAIGDRIRAVCVQRGVEVVCAYQEKQDLPGGYVCPEDRVKPWGTGHALLSCKGLLHGGFAVINADDYYGKEAYRQMSELLDELGEDSKGVYGLAGFLLANTLSDNGGVTRGLCSRDEKGYLTGISETKQIQKSPDGPCVHAEEGLRLIDGLTPVSMNMWAFTPDVLELLEAQFVDFLRRNLNEQDSEFLLPIFIGDMLSQGVQVKVVPIDGQWFGMTYSADTLAVRQALQKMTDEGSYPNPLF